MPFSSTEIPSKIRYSEWCGSTGTRLEDRVDHAVLGDAALDDVDVQVDEAGHFDGAAERDFTVPLREVNVTHRQLGAVDVDWEVDSRTARQVLDVAVAAVFARRDGPGGLLGDPIERGPLE